MCPQAWAKLTQCTAETFMRACHKRARVNSSAGWGGRKHTVPVDTSEITLKLTLLRLHTENQNRKYLLQISEQNLTKPAWTFTSKTARQAGKVKLESDCRSRLIRVGATSLECWLSGTVSLAAWNERDTTNSRGRAQRSPVIWSRVYNRLWPVTNQEPADNHPWDSG